MASIAVIHSGFQGHMRPMARVAQVLRDEGHHVLALAPAFWREVIDGSFDAFADDEPVPVFIPDRPHLDQVFEHRLHALEQVEATAQVLLDAGCELIVYDIQHLAAPLAAELLGLPTISVQVTYPAGEAITFTLTAEQIRLANRFDQTGQRRWGRLTHAGGTSGAGDIALVTSAPPLLAEEDVAAHAWRPVGPLLSPAPPAQLRRDALPPVVYVALGTIFGSSREVFETVIEALRGLSIRVLISTGGALLPDLAAEEPNVEVQTFVDHRAVLRTCRVHVTHGGAGSVQESLVEGVPMACVPLGSDQRAWAQRVDDLGAGKLIEPLDPRMLRGTVEELLGEHPAHGIAERVGRRLLEFDGRSVIKTALAELGVEPHPSAQTLRC